MMGELVIVGGARAIHGGGRLAASELCCCFDVMLSLSYGGIAIA